jgi:hypothetical protein
VGTTWLNESCASDQRNSDGLGIKDLEKHSCALRLHWLWYKCDVVDQWQSYSVSVGWAAMEKKSTVGATVLVQC